MHFDAKMLLFTIDKTVINLNNHNIRRKESIL